MPKEKGRNMSSRNEGNLASSKPNYSTTESPGYSNKIEKQDDLKSHLMIVVEDFKKDINNSLKKYRRT